MINNKEIEGLRQAQTDINNMVMLSLSKHLPYFKYSFV